MYVDDKLVLSGAVSTTGVLTGQAVSSVGSTVVSSNIIDLSAVTGSLTRDIGEGEDIYARFSVIVAVSGGTSLEMQVVTADDTGLSTNAVVLATTGAIAVASLTAGARFALEIPPRLLSKGQQYLGCKFVSVGTTTAITVFADLGHEVQDGQKFYPSGFSIL